MSPTERTLKAARKLGWICQVVERFNPHARVRIDLFGCIDVLCIAGDRIVGIQACAGASHSNRRNKALAEPRLRGWLAAGGLFEVWSFAMRGPRGKMKHWTLRREAVDLKSIEDRAAHLAAIDAIENKIALPLPGAREDRT